MQIHQIKNNNEKQTVTREILEALPEWFGNSDAREEYIKESVEFTCFCAYEDNKVIGILCLKETGKATIEIAVMGVRKEYQNIGAGRSLFTTAKNYALENEYSFMQVKTVQMGIYAAYDNTNLFYKRLGFKEFEVFPELWDKTNPCQIYVMALK